MFYGLQLWWKAFWGRQRFIPLFNVFTRLNKHILKERNFWPCWEYGKLGSTLEWQLSRDWHLLITTKAIVGSKGTVVRSPSVHSQAPNPRAALSQPYLKSPSSFQIPINTCEKTLPFNGVGESGRLRMHNWCYFFGGFYIQHVLI